MFVQCTQSRVTSYTTIFLFYSPTICIQFALLMKTCVCRACCGYVFVCLIQRQNWSRFSWVYDVLLLFFIFYFWAHTPRHKVSSDGIWESGNCKNVKKIWNNIMRTKFFLAGVNEKWNVCSGRILLGDNACCGRSRSSVLESGFQLYSLVYTHIYLHIR
jgi:hypothetical protein